MYRFNTLNEYKKRLGQLNRKIRSLKRHHADAQSIVNCEALKLSYLIEMKDFSLRNDWNMPAASFHCSSGRRVPRPPDYFTRLGGSHNGQTEQHPPFFS